MNKEQFPVYQQRQKILSLLNNHRVVIVEAETGSGKTTIIPIILREAGFAEQGVIGITQPRRIAAISVSQHIKELLHNSDASTDEVAFKIRFLDTSSPATKIKLMTDGILLQEIKADPQLSRYSVLIIDEAHERSLNIDFILGLIKLAISDRRDLKIIISSATINAHTFSKYFDNAPIARIQSRMFPVNILYAPPKISFNPESIIEKICKVVTNIVHKQRGDILVFLSGEKIIKDCISALQKLPFGNQLYLVPLYGRLSKEEQDEAFVTPPSGKTKIVVATNIAETSITIDGITSVIDSGLGKIYYYNPQNNTSSLREEQISRTSAKQRAGRAGRTQAGTCYRLYHVEDFKQRPLYTKEEIYRRDLSEVVLRMAELDIRNFLSFDFISAPGKRGIKNAVQTLQDLRALNSDHSLTAIGKLMIHFPLLPRHSRIIVESMLHCPEILNEILIVVSFISTNPPFLLPKDEEILARKAHYSFSDSDGDFMSFIKIFNAFRKATGKSKAEEFCSNFYLDFQVMEEIVNIYRQLKDIVQELNTHIDSVTYLSDRTHKTNRFSSNTFRAQFISSIATGLVHFICFRTGKKNYKSYSARNIELHPSTVLFSNPPDIIVAGEIVHTTKRYARIVSRMEKEWVPAIAPWLKYLLPESEKSAKKRNRTKTSARRNKKQRKN